ncbi:hypothetical protein ACFYTQ_35335 [Nocardia sp. NPDC004068]|uniref:COG4705 family protein n=1 Tax=Nocardia sp. NPDC004068 TaxID=3364303 RepID=UPI00369A4967
MTESTKPQDARAGRMLSKVPEVTVWFWIIKILCTTVGESFADWINTSLGAGLNLTALIFTIVLAVVGGWQLWLDRYVPAVYWLTVVVLSVTGTLYTDILTDNLGVPLAVSSMVFAAVLAVVFGVWYARERTLSIHSIVTTPRELFYWLTVLVTFALGTATGDWTLTVTGWGPGVSVLLPAALIAAIALGRRFGANAVLSFWLAYILTRPLGANLGDWLASPTVDHGLGLGTGFTSILFLAAILATVVYLTYTRVDVITDAPHTSRPGVAVTSASPIRERVMLGYYTAVAILAAILLGWAATQPHTASSAADEESGASITTAPVAPGQTTTHFPAAEVAKFRTIIGDTLTRVQAGSQAGAKARITDLETAWDGDQSTLQPLDGRAWEILDGQIDAALKAVRAARPDPATEIRTLTTLLATLG